jgi:hypothetical protein
MSGFQQVICRPLIDTDEPADRFSTAQQIGGERVVVEGIVL